MSKPVITGFSQSTFVWTTRAALAIKGVDHDFHAIDPGQHKTPEHLALHPFGKVPAMTHGELTVFETLAICTYVDTAFEGPALRPSSPAALARMHQWYSVAQCYVYDAGISRFALQFIFPSGPDGKPNMQTIEAAKPDIRKVLEAVDAGLGDSTWIAGDDISLADLILGPLLLCIQMFPGGKELFVGFDNVGRLLGQLTQHEAFMSVAPARE
jgi:glutathione S-transferase